MNNKFEIVHQFDLYEKYKDKILKFFLGDTFDDVVVITGIWMYIFSYDLRLKSRIDMTATRGEDNAIMNLDENLARGLEKIIDFAYNDDGSVTKPFEGTDVTGVYTKIDANGDVTYEAPSVSLINYPYNHTKIQLETSPLNKGKVPLEKYDNEKNKISLGERLIGVYSNRMLGLKPPTFKGSVFIPSRLCGMICEYNSILYKNNLYIPIHQNVLKVVMCPDVAIDFEMFSDEER